MTSRWARAIAASAMCVLCQFVCGPANAAIQPPEFAATLKNAPTKEGLFDAVETLASRNHEPAYSDLETVVRSLIKQPEFRNVVVTALGRFPVRSFLSDLAALLPARWASATEDDRRVASALSALGGPTAVGLIASAVTQAVAEQAAPEVVDSLIADLITADPATALDTVLRLSAFKDSRPVQDFWVSPIEKALNAASQNGDYHDALIRIAQDMVTARLQGSAGSYGLRAGTDATSARISRGISRSLARLGSVPALSTLAFFALSDDAETRSYATGADYGPLAAAPWLTTDPVAFAEILRIPEPAVGRLLSDLKYPLPTVYPLATASQQLVVRRLLALKTPDQHVGQAFTDVPVVRSRELRQLDTYVFQNLANLMSLGTLKTAELPYDFSPDESLPMASELSRLSRTVAFGLGPLKLEPSGELAAAYHLVSKQYQLLALTLYSLVHAENAGISIGPHGSIAEIDGQFDVLAARTDRPDIPVTRVVTTLPAVPPPDGSRLPCQRQAVTARVTNRSVSLASGQYVEELLLTCANGATTSVYWEGSVPFAILSALKVHPRLLDFAGISLALREWRAATQSFSSRSDDLDLLTEFPERLIPLLILSWNTADPRWKDIHDVLLTDLRPLRRDPIHDPHSGLFSVVPWALDPPLPPGLAYLADRIPASGMYPSSTLDSLTTLFNEQLKALFAAKETFRVLPVARQITQEKMPDTIAQQYSIPCGEGGGAPQTCTLIQIGENMQKRQVLANYDNRISEARQQEAALAIFDLGTVGNRATAPVSLLRGWTSPDLTRFAGLYLLPQPNGDRVVFSNVNLDNTPVWMRASVCAYPSVLSRYRVDLWGASRAGAQNAALVVATLAHALEYAELSGRDAVAFARHREFLEVPDGALKSTEYGQYLLREVNWQRSMFQLSDLGPLSTEDAATPDFTSAVFGSWDNAAAALSQAVAKDQQQVRETLTKQFDPGFTFGISYTFGGILPFGVSLGAGAWAVGVSTDFSSVVSVFPTWNSIGVPIPIHLGGAGPPAGPPAPIADVGEPVSTERTEGQAMTETFTASRAGDSKLSGPASYMEFVGSVSDDPGAWTAYLDSLIHGVPNWSEAKATALVGGLMRCKRAVDDHTPCSVFVTNVLKSVFGIDEFGGFGDKANAIAVYLANNPGLWEKLGNGTSQEAMNKAQAEANAGRAVIAVWKNPDSKKAGHIAIIIPGVVRESSYWGGLMVPNAAQTRVTDDKHFGDLSGVWIGRPVSNSFGPDKQPEVYFYVRR